VPQGAASVIGGAPGQPAGRRALTAHEGTTDMPDRKVLLSTLWVFATLNYLYADVVTLMDPVKHTGSIQLTPGFLLGASILVEIPMAMVLLSRIVPYQANRWVNIIAGTVMTVVQLVTLFVGTPTLYYLFFSVIEVATTAFIVWYAWTWRTPSSPRQAPPPATV
jgi:hypothetical protein